VIGARFADSGPARVADHLDSKPRVDLEFCQALLVVVFLLLSYQCLLNAVLSSLGTRATRRPKRHQQKNPKPISEEKDHQSLNPSRNLRGIPHPQLRLDRCSLRFRKLRSACLTSGALLVAFYRCNQLKENFASFHSCQKNDWDKPQVSIQFGSNYGH